MLTPLASLRTGLELRLTAESRAWLHRALAEAADTKTGAGTTASGTGADTTASATGPGTAENTAGPRGLPAWELHFVTAGRNCRPAERHAQAGHDVVDAARVLLLHAAAPGTDTVVRLYERGSADERRAVLLALPHLDPPPGTPRALALVEDALRTNDTRLVAAALGPYAATHLDAHQWRQGVLKCLFTGVPVDAVAGLEHRAAGDGELARMLTDYARERSAAGRTVPEDLHRVLRLARFEDT
ncbi:EboA domain-containing protein [Streptomyces albus]|uniref:EboA domain-containing protein n=1 Tax=unclassified Streptomyces TaxID=2593676 RepID=UPI0004BD5999|nr:MULTISPECIES: EboA domain-containing protein [unclassified Streptomyces]KPC95266.1 sugar phosphate isomerase [Streptomyces sp. NRRL F-6602]